MAAINKYVARGRVENVYVREKVRNGVFDE